SGAPFGQHASEGRQHLLGTRVYRTGRTDGEPLVAPRTAWRMIVVMTTISEDPIRRVFSHGDLIDITTTGRRTGQPRRIEIVYHVIDGRLCIRGMTTADRRRHSIANHLRLP